LERFVSSKNSEQEKEDDEEEAATVLPDSIAQVYRTRMGREIKVYQ
jgi:hypothetical protein